jgi:hypothetical protein
VNRLLSKAVDIEPSGCIQVFDAESYEADSLLHTFFLAVLKRDEHYDDKAGERFVLTIVTIPSELNSAGRIC